MSATAEMTRPAGIRCGHCQDRHATVAEVRACSTGRPAAPAPAAPAAPKALGRFPDNLNEAALRAELRLLEKNAAPGRYAVRDAEDATMIRFYKIDIPTEGRWAGAVFISQVTGHVGEEGVRIKHPARRAEVLAAISAAGPVESERLYGQEIGRCARCSRVLTNPESRAFGIGPECREK